jgi:glycosyltransferase involved in cell wall biosynthesis
LVHGRKRKGWPILIEAFLQEFDQKESVQLLLKTDKPQQASKDIEKMRLGMNLKKECPLFYFESRIFDDAHLPSFYKSADCLVMPTLGEGFGLPGLQSMAVGTPVIVTNFSGCQDYAAEDKCTLLEPSGFVLQSNMDNILQFNNKKWPRVTVKNFARCYEAGFYAI